MRERLPWHDTVIHYHKDGEVCGPVAPFCRRHSALPPHSEHVAVTHVQCAACGDDWHEDDPEKLARIWWSQGAWDGIQSKGLDG